MNNGNWFDYMPELGDPPTADLMAGSNPEFDGSLDRREDLREDLRPSVTTLFGAPAARKPAQREIASGPVVPSPANHPVGEAKLESGQLGFILGGAAYFTLVSEKTGVRYTYRVSKADDKGDGRPAPWFVSLLVGPDNYANYRYMGIIGGADKRFRTTAKSAFAADSGPVKAFTWTYGWLLRGELAPKVEFWHAGKCAKCGRKLTVPESVATGIGPECAKKGMAA